MIGIYTAHFATILINIVLIYLNFKQLGFFDKIYFTKYQGKRFEDIPKIELIKLFLKDRDLIDENPKLYNRIYNEIMLKLEFDEEKQTFVLKD